MRYALKADTSRQATAHRIVDAAISRIPGESGFSCQIDQGEAAQSIRAHISKEVVGGRGADSLSECYLVNENGAESVVPAETFEEEWIPVTGEVHQEEEQTGEKTPAAEDEVQDGFVEIILYDEEKGEGEPD